MKKMTRLCENLPILLTLLIITGCRSSSPTFNFGAYSEAERFYQKGEYQKAVNKYNEYIRENPEGNMAVIAQYYMGKSYDAIGDKEQAKQIYGKIVKEHPELVWAEFSKSRLQELQSAAPAKAS